MHNRDTMADASIAYIWYSLAYVNGYKQAKDARDEVVQQLDIDTILGVQNVANRVYKLLKQGDDLEAHSVINLLDKLYGRKGYRPTDEMLETLALGRIGKLRWRRYNRWKWEELASKLHPATVVSKATEAAATHTKTAQTDLNTDGQALNADSGVMFGTDSRHPSMSGYQQQPWQTSWDSLLTENGDNEH